MRGQVIRVSGVQSLVEIEDAHWQCEIRGRLKSGIRTTNSPIIAGDWVEVTPTTEHAGIIELVHPRTSQFSRAASGSRSIEQNLSVNIDQLIVVVSAKQPSPRVGFIDRAIMMAIKGNIKPIICVNKTDLTTRDAIDLLIAPYEALEYPVYRTSALHGEGMRELNDTICERISIVVGQSGVGKSTILNFIEPGLGLRTGEIMKRHNRGRHTTTAVQWFKLKCGGYIVDTPGIKELRLWGIKSTELGRYFPEFEDFIQQCQFVDCSHLHEPSCAVRQAKFAGDIAESRYEGYRRIFESLQEYE